MSRASPLTVSAQATVRRNTSSLMPWWKRLPMNMPSSIEGNRIAVTIEHVAAEFADREIADAADDRQRQQDRRHGGAVVVLGELDGVEIHREEHAAHGADDGAGHAAAEPAQRGRDPRRQVRLGRAPNVPHSE